MDYSEFQLSRGTSPRAGVPDMTVISDIDELGIKQNLQVRYSRNQIYTYTGTILVAVNPYKELDIYTQSKVCEYHGAKMGSREPHVFALAEAAYSSLQRLDVDQSCVISGESGAGKTETTKFILQYLCSVTSNVSTWVEQQILEANTILEAFGNAKTVRNDNSSRFGKFMQVCFDAKWMIKGCIIQDYLLEQSRITFQSPGERNYHVFYQLVEAAQVNKELAETLKLRPVEHYKYLNQSGCVRIEGVSDARKFDALRLAFNVLRIPMHMCEGIFKVLSAILWLGNTTFQDIDGEKCKLAAGDSEILNIVADLLGLQFEDVVQVVLLRQINVRGSITEIPLKIQEARENRHAMAKALYSRVFAWLVNHINTCTNPGQDSSRFLGVLDIFGFENFAVNSFEQLCINYTNEKLHKFFNHYVFALEQEIYRQEEIQFSHIQFTDNTSCLELIEKPPRCILKLLTEQCHMPKGSDSAYLVNLHAEFEQHPCYVKGEDRRRWEREFGVVHYAGCVTYTVAGFVDKNRDVTQDVFFDFMSRSTNEFVGELTKYQDLLGTTVARMGQGGGTTARGTSKGKPTVGDTFRYQLQALVEVLQATNPWYVRCIKPNMKKAPDDFDARLVLDQLKYLGMLDIIRIRREGYPVHLAFPEFLARYRCLVRAALPEACQDAIQTIIKQQSIPKTEWQIGKTKIFLRTKAHEPLEDKRNHIILTRVVCVQSLWRRYVHRKEFLRVRKAAVVIQHAVRGWTCRMRFLRERRAAILIQSRLRGVFAREVATALREMRRVEEEMRKRERMEEERCRAKEEEDAILRLKQEELEKKEKEAEAEMAALASQLNQRLAADQQTRKPEAQSVDLDGLFAFLSDVQQNGKAGSNGVGTVPATSHIIDQIGAKMNELVSDLDIELESVIQQELEGLHEMNENNNIVSPPPKIINNTPSLPEPTGPPPPPPQSQPVEPIYESVLPRDDSAPPIPEPIPEPPPAPLMTKLRAKSPALERIVKSNHVSANPSPKNSRPNSRSSNASGGAGWRHGEEAEREQRRKVRVERKLQEMEEEREERPADPLQVEVFHDLVEFAQDHFNNHERSPEGTIIATLTRKRKSLEMIPKYEMVTYYKGSSIPTSHIHMYDPDNVNLACSVFRDLCKYMRGDLKAESELETLQRIIGAGLERDELRDEILVQCMRQATNNPSPEAAEKVWLLLCLVVVAFQPSKLLHKYFVCFLHKHLQSEGKLRQYVQWCLDNCKTVHVTSRQLPPSSVEVAAMKKLGTIVCRFFFLDGRTKAIDVHPSDTAGDAAGKLADKLGLRSLDGWAIYQSRADGEEYVRGHHYLYDVIAQWEIKQTKSSGGSGGFASLGRRSSSNAGVGAGENRFIFKRRLFKSSREISQDPVEVNLLYAQAVHHVVKCDDFPVSEKVALQLAGLQAQVALGDPRDVRLDYYTDIDTFLPYRVSRSRGEDVWVPIIAEAHRQYGAGRSEMMAKVLYLSCVMQYPLYGTTMFSVTYRGYWSYGNDLILGVNWEGLMLIKPEDKFVLVEFRYPDIESLFLDPSDSFVTINLMDQGAHRCFVLETAQKTEIGSLIISYYPALAAWITEQEAPAKAITNEDRLRLYNNVVNCRRLLVNGDLLKKPQDSASNFIRNTLRRLSKNRLEKIRLEYGGLEQSETYKGFSYSFWAFSRQCIAQSLSRLPEPEEQIALQMFQIILTYAGLGQNGETVRRAEDEHLSLVQGVMERAMRKDSLLTELYLQLIKQTTDHPDPNSRVNLRHWALLCLACSVVLPAHRLVRKFLVAHLKRCSSDCVSEEGKYARFAEKCVLKTQGTRRRQWPPSREEILCTINRRPIYARFYFMDGSYHAVEFHPSATARDAVALIRAKLGLREGAMGYAIYEVLGSSERSLVADEKVADVMSKWERYRNAAAAQNQQKTPSRKQTHAFLFKKHLFLDQYMDLEDPVEKELLYHQVLHGLRSDRFPVSEKEAVMLGALQAQVELGDCPEHLQDYRQVAAHCLPARLVPALPSEGVYMHHQSLRGMTPAEAKKAFLNLIRSWPLHRATIFDVMQSFTSNWPRVLWLAVDQVGLHLLEHRSRNALVTYDYESVLSYSPALNCLMIITGSDRKQSKVILTTSQAFQIANLIREYAEVLQSPGEVRKREKSGGGNSSRPLSILHKPAPVIEPQPS